MRKVNKIIINIVVLYFMYLFFYGIIIKFTIFNNYLFALKTYIPEILLIIDMLLILITTKFRTNKITFYLIGYIFLTIILNYICNGVNKQSFYWWRDVFIPLGATTFLMQIDFTEDEIEYMLKKLRKLGKIFLICGLVLAIIQQVKGYEWTSKFYTGYVFYGQDSYSKVKIAHNMGLLRAPSLTGNFSTFAYYSCFSLLLILANKNKKINNIFWILVALINCILSTNKSAIIVIIAVLAIRYTINIRKKNKNLNKIFFVLLTMLLLLFVLANSASIFSLDSQYTGGFLQRFDVWKGIWQELDILQLIVPYKMFLYGSGSEGLSSFFDNLYLYCFISQGIIGSILWIKFIKNLYNNCLKCSYKNVDILVKDLMYFFLIVGLTSNIVQGHAYFCIFIIFLSIIYQYKK